MMRNLLHISTSVILLLLFQVCAMAQDINSLKAGVVRINNTVSGQVGAGVIVKLERDRIYIVTASHIVKGSGNPQVYLFTHQLDPMSAELVHRDDENPKGLALLVLRLSNVEGLKSLTFGNSSQVSGGEGIKAIGFPGGISSWDVSTGAITRVEGNNLIFAPPIKAGNSGGPVILSDGRVIGLVTDTTDSQSTSTAPKAEVVVSYVNGIIAGLIPSASTGAKTGKVTLNITLNKIAVHQDGSFAGTNWRFEVFADTESIIPLDERGFNDNNAKPVVIEKSADFNVEVEKGFTIKVVGDKSEEKVQAIGAKTLQWPATTTSNLSVEIPVKVPGKIKKGDFTFYFTVKKK